MLLKKANLLASYSFFAGLLHSLGFTHAILNRVPEKVAMYLNHSFGSESVKSFFFVGFRFDLCFQRYVFVDKLKLPFSF